MAGSRSQLFTASGTFNVPTDVTSVFVTMTGGGGGGGPPLDGDFGAACGGGAGEFCRRRPVKVTSGAAITVTIGAGGTSTFDLQAGGNGGTSSFGTFIFCQGGFGGLCNRTTEGAVFPNNGHGGGSGGSGNDSSPYNPFDFQGVPGYIEGAVSFGGGSGSGMTSDAGLRGGGCEGYTGGAGGAMGDNFGGSGGAASNWGPGGAGAQGKSGSTAFNGLPAPAGSYGAGGGGAGGRTFGNTNFGGLGGDGACLVEWMGA